MREVAAATPVQELSGGELTKLGLLNLAASNPRSYCSTSRRTTWTFAALNGCRRSSGRSADRWRWFRTTARCSMRARPTSWRSTRTRTGPRTFAGGYSAYAAEKARREEEKWERFRRQQREERQLRRTISAIESRSRNVENRTIDFYFRKRAAKVGAAGGHA